MEWTTSSILGPATGQCGATRCIATVKLGKSHVTCGKLIMERIGRMRPNRTTAKGVDHDSAGRSIRNLAHLTWTYLPKRAVTPPSVCN